MGHLSGLPKMTAPIKHGRLRRWVALLARWILGAVFLYLGANKALHPIEFLKVLRQYDITDRSGLLNGIAAFLPWLEIFTAGALLSGRAVRGSAWVCLGMLLPFTGAILNRALALQAAQAIPFCAIRFDCGCGTGEVVICHKLLENGLLILLSLLLLKRGGPNPAPQLHPAPAA